MVSEIKQITDDLHFFWSYDEDWLAVKSQGSVYVLQISKGSRQKIVTSEKVDQLLWMADKLQLLWADANHQLFLLNVMDGQSHNLGVQIDLAKSKWIPNGLLVYVQNDDEIVRIKTFDPISLESTLLIEKEAFVADKIEWDPSSYTLYIYNQKDTRWYQMEF